MQLAVITNYLDDFNFFLNEHDYDCDDDDLISTDPPSRVGQEDHQ